MTISTVNEEMIEDFKMKTLEDLGSFVPSIEAEGNVYNNQEIRFRGLLTRNQLYEFMPRYSPLDWYNVGRSDIIRGANSLIYGQADPGGKVNVLSKTANLNKNKGSILFEVGDKNWKKVTYDENVVLSDKTAARFMLIDKRREFDANFKYQSFQGGTVELLHVINPQTRFRLHLEQGVAERSLIGGTFKVGQSPIGLPSGIVADPKLADLISDEFLDEISNYAIVNPYDHVNFDSIYPYSNSEQDANGDRYNYGFIDLNKNGILEKNFTDRNFNGSHDKEAPLIAWIDGNDDGIINITEPFEYDDVNGNGRWDGLPEPFATIKNGKYDVGENYQNILNGKYDEGELFIDSINGVWDEGEEFTDSNNNGKYDEGELFTDSKNEIYDEGEFFLDNVGFDLGQAPYQEGGTFEDSGDYSPEEYGWAEEVDDIHTIFHEDGTALFSYIDADGNGKFTSLYNPDTRQFIDGTTERFAFIDKDGDNQWDASGEAITSWDDLDGNGTLNYLEKSEEFTDSNFNGVYDEGEEFVDTYGNGVWDEGEEFTDEINGVYDEGEEFVDDNGNNEYDEGEEFIDAVNGIYDLGEDFVDTNGVWDAADFILPAFSSTRNLGDGESLKIWTPMEEPYQDLNNNSIYDDSDYASGGLMVRSVNPNIWEFTPSGGTLVPDFIENRQDIRNLFRGIDFSNSGTGFGPDSYSKKKFDFILADIDHSFNDDLSVKVSLAYEDLYDKQLSSGWSANNINFSSGYGITVRFPTLRSINAFYADESNNGLTTPFEAVLVDLTNANYAHLALDNIDNLGLENVKEEMRTAMREWDSTWFDRNGDKASFSFSEEAEKKIDPYGSGITTDKIVDYWVENFLDLSEADTQLEKLYEIAKFSGRVQNFLAQSHSNYYQNNGYSYLWGNSGGLGDPIYNSLTGSDLGKPSGSASTQIFELDRYINVQKYREQLRNWDSAGEKFQENKYVSIDEKFKNDASIMANIKQGKYEEGDELENGYEFFIYTDNFSLDTDGERLIYDSIPLWLLQDNQREMKALDQVELYDQKTVERHPNSGGYDDILNVSNENEVELQRRAIAKKVYDFLVEDIKDADSDSEFWDATKKIYDFFKYDLHHENDFSWMWEQRIQPTLLSKIDAIVEDQDYLTDNKTFVDLDGDGNRDETLPSVLKSSGEILQPFIKRQWKKSNNKDNNKSARITFNYDLPKNKFGIIPGKQNLLLGLDLDDRNASRSEEQLVSQNVRTWGDFNNLYLRTDILSDYVPLADILAGTEGSNAFFDFNINGHESLGAPNWLANNRIPYGEENIANWADVYYADAVVQSKGLWFAASGSYNNGKLRTLIGIRRDHITTESEYTKFTLRAQKTGDGDSDTKRENKSNDLDEVIYCPSVGALYWFTQNFAIFGNYSESVISPTGFQYDVFGDITPPETGKGKEIGFKVSTSDNVLNGQLTVFSIDKKNEQRQNISWPMLTAIYPARDESGLIRTEPYENGYLPEDIYDTIEYRDRLGRPSIDSDGNVQVRAIFNPKGYRVADEEVRSEGLELDLYYNPNNNISMFLGYAYLDTKILKSALNILEGLPTAGTSDHNLNFTFKYSFKRGNYKGLQLGINQKYRSAALLSHYFVDLDGDNQADYFPVQVEDKKTGVKSWTNPRYHTLWLEDQHSTDFFIKWSGKIRKQFPWTVFQFNINNVFDNKNLISTGLNNARYTEGRNIAFSGGIYF